jgi:enoyl-CoA hydratase
MHLHTRRTDDVGVIRMQSGAVNAFSLGLRRELVDAFAAMAADASIAAIVVHGSGKGFSAGGDRSEFGTPSAAARPTLSRDVLRSLDDCGKPVVAAMHGFAVGGGLEFALACTARVVIRDTRVGLPEVTIGRFPLSGTQRLPRLLGVTRAAEWILQGDIETAGSPGLAALFDQFVDESAALLPAAIARAQVLTGAPLLRVRDRPLPGADPRAEFAAIERRFPSAGCTAAQRAALAALRAAVEGPDFQAGLEHAQRLFDELAAEPTA